MEWHEPASTDLHHKTQQNGTSDIIIILVTQVQVRRYTVAPNVHASSTEGARFLGRRARKATLKPLHGTDHRLCLHTLPLLRKIGTPSDRLIQLQQEAFVSSVNSHASNDKNQRMQEPGTYLSNEFRKARFMKKVR